MVFKSDGVVHHPIGGGSEVFETDIVRHLLAKVKKNKIKISVGSQPDASLHFGTLTIFTLAFKVAKKIIETDKTKEVSVLFEVVDTAPSKITEINGLRYQKSIQATGVLNKYMNQYLEILNYLKTKTGIDYEIRYQSEFNKQKEIYPIVKDIIKQRNKIKNILDPKHGNLRIRIPCPQCGLADKIGLKNKYKGDLLKCECPIHGEYEINLKEQSERLEYNTPLRNLVRALVYAKINKSHDYDYHLIRITGSDYAGFYQEELLYKVVSILGYKTAELPIILYSPLILDWSGAKLSKSLYKEKGAYEYLPKFLMSYEALKREYGIRGLDYIFEIVNEWVENPYMLFRHYSIYYFMEEFKKRRSL